MSKNLALAYSFCAGCCTAATILGIEDGRTPVFTAISGGIGVATALFAFVESASLITKNSGSRDRVLANSRRQLNTVGDPSPKG